MLPKVFAVVRIFMSGKMKVPQSEHLWLGLYLLPFSWCIMRVKASFFQATNTTSPTNWWQTATHTCWTSQPTWK
jgi:hypothetical protein